jgi:Dolichyl-phosphate-mannose-protein mannosyltransferase
VIAESTWTMVGNALLGLGANGALLLGSYSIARYGFKQPRGLSAALATAVVFWCACTVGLEVLGTFGALALEPMLVWGLMVGLIGGGLWWLRPEVNLGPSIVATDESVSWDAVLSVAGLLSAALVLGMKSLLLGVKVVSDGPIYHLYFAARWWKAGRLFLVAVPFGESAATYFPANGDLWFAWLMATCGGDRLAKVGQAPFLVLASLAAYGCARRLGAGRSASLVATCWFASSTPLLIFSFEPNVDTIFVAGYLMAAYFILRASEGAGDTAAFFLGALAAGAALGTKTVAVVFVPPVLALAMVAILVQAVPARTKILRTLVVLAAPLVSGGFWYIRDALLTGNPLYPLEVRVLGRSLLHGWYLPEAMIKSPYYLPFAEWRALGDILLAVLDPRLTPFWIAALVLGWAIKTPTTDGARRRIAIFSIMAVLNVVLYWVCIPYRTQQRFMLQALGLAVVPLAITFDHNRWIRRAGALLITLHLFTPQDWPFARADGSLPWDLTPIIPNSMGDPVLLFSRIGRALQPDELKRSPLGLEILIGIVVCALFMVWGWGRLSSRARRSGLRLTVIAVSSVFFVVLGYLDVWRDLADPRLRFYPAFPDFFAGWLELESRSGTSGTRVAYAGTNIPYYLFASGLRNQVRYVNINRHRDWLMHDYHGLATKRGQGNWPNSRPGWDRLEPDFQAWLDNLESEETQLLVVTRVNPQEGSHNVADSDNFPIERRWADSHPEWFEPLYGQRENDRWFRLYRLRRGRTVRAPHMAEHVQDGARSQSR